jgi:hypothetical protein
MEDNLDVIESYFNGESFGEEELLNLFEKQGKHFCRDTLKKFGYERGLVIWVLNTGFFSGKQNILKQQLRKTPKQQ